MLDHEFKILGIDLHYDGPYRIYAVNIRPHLTIGSQFTIGINYVTSTVGCDGVALDVSALLRRDGFVVPAPGEYYILKTGWHFHIFATKGKVGPCEPGSVIFIRSVDEKNRTCSVVLLDGNTTYEHGQMSFVDIHIMFERAAETP